MLLATVGLATHTLALTLTLAALACVDLPHRRRDERFLRQLFTGAYHREAENISAPAVFGTLIDALLF